ncbi:hypothetical protein BV898_02435 [Hypsibius exemplaris]|uniref:PIN domain-containing protein n=1 Tax=Hypsibius exemplaris TaxID=2072580 RepID=A0A1W0X848_HYPEX|nr:hypothetical protein BV898_02435 [Hypsibius exemplaris]
MPETFLSIVLDTSVFINLRYPNLEHFASLINDGILRIPGTELHVPYAVKSELRFHAGNHPNIRVQALALDARRWLADNHDGLRKQTWMENSHAETLFPGQPRDQVLHYVCQRLQQQDGTPQQKYAECWLLTEDPLLRTSVKANASSSFTLRAFDIASFQREMTTLFPVNYLNTKWMTAATENRMEQERLMERRKRARFVLVLEAGVLLKPQSLLNFLAILGKDRREDFKAGIQLDVPKVVMDELVEVQKDIACRWKHPDAMVKRALQVMDKYATVKEDSHVQLHLEKLEHFVEGKVMPGGKTEGAKAEYDEAMIKYCRRLVEQLGDTHVVALLTADPGKRKLMRTEKFQVVTLWPA